MHPFGTAEPRLRSLHNRKYPLMSHTWLPTLITADPQSGYELAVTLARIVVKLTQPNDKIRRQLRTKYEKDADSLIASSSVVAVHFQTVAAANGYWRPSS